MNSWTGFPIVPSAVPMMHQLSRAPDSITLSWPQPDRPNGDILEYQIRFYDKVHTLSGASNGPNLPPLQNHNMSFCVPQGSDVDSATSVYSETNTLTVTSLIPGSIYAFQIRARNERGYGPYSNTIYFTTLPLGTTLACCHSNKSHYSHKVLFHRQCQEPLVLGTSQPRTLNSFCCRNVQKVLSSAVKFLQFLGQTQSRVQVLFYPG